MTLRDWMGWKDVTSRQLAVDLGVSSKCVEKWKYGERTPRYEEMIKIYWQTSRNVEPNDFYDLSRRKK